MRQHYPGPHNLFTTADGETLFLRRWNPDSLEPAKKNIAVLIFHGFPAYSGPYSMAGMPLSKGGYTTFGLDYRGHGLSGGNRGDSPGKIVMQNAIPARIPLESWEEIVEWLDKTFVF